jgi:oxygen-independent coproporphyrinogen-3 oxidase
VLSLPPLALYVHLPWCERKCPYCDFNSHAAGSDPPFAAYVTRLLEDLEQDLRWLQGRAIGSIFLGGGTPSLFPAGQIARLLDGVRARVTLAPHAEVTLEANPGSAEAGKFADFRAAGVNRLSIGVQSFDDRCLQALGRVHDAREAHSAVEAAQAAGYTNFNIDLMHGLPGQDAGGATRDLDAALAHGSAHVSWYQLTIEANTRFHSAPPPLPAEDELAAIQAAGERRLAAGGLEQYEVSAWARAGCRAAHNLNYWNFGDYIGIGAGAHGKLTLAAGARVLRTLRTRVPRDYLEAPLARARQCREVPPGELPLEYLMNALRLREGTPLAQFAARAGACAREARPALLALRREGLLDPDPEVLRASALGYRHLDALLARLA